jgi:hypothetical protein
MLSLNFLLLRREIMSYRVIFFADTPQEHTKALRKSLPPEFISFVSTNTDEYRQVFFQSGRFVLVFGDPNKAMAFRKREDPNLTGLEYDVFLYLSCNAKFKIESQKLLDDAGITVFRLNESEKLFESVSQSLSNPLVPDELDLEFYKPPDSPDNE